MKFIIDVARAVFGLLLSCIVIVAVAPEKLDFVVISQAHLPITGAMFIAYCSVGVGLLLSGYTTTLVIEIVCLSGLRVFRRVMRYWR